MPRFLWLCPSQDDQAELGEALLGLGQGSPNCAVRGVAIGALCRITTVATPSRPEGPGGSNLRPWCAILACSAHQADTAAPDSTRPPYRSPPR